MANATFENTAPVAASAEYCFRGNKDGGSDGAGAMEVYLQCVSGEAVFFQIDRIHEAAPVTITSSGTTATVTKADHGLATGDYVTISGATESVFNGTVAVTVTGANTFTYTMSGSNSNAAATGSPTCRDWCKMDPGTDDKFFSPNQGTPGMQWIKAFSVGGAGKYTQRVTGK